jgi:hypothetical protein
MLCAAAAVFALTDAVLIAGYWSAQRREPIRWLTFDEAHVKPQNAEGLKHLVSVSRRAGRWTGENGGTIENLRDHVRTKKERVLRGLAGSHPRVFDVSIFVTLGRDASIDTFFKTLEELRQNEICSVGFNDLVQPDRMGSGERYEAIPTFLIC